MTPTQSILSFSHTPLIFFLLFDSLFALIGTNTNSRPKEGPEQNVDLTFSDYQIASLGPRSNTSLGTITDELWMR